MANLAVWSGVTTIDVSSAERAAGYTKLVSLCETRRNTDQAFPVVMSLSHARAVVGSGVSSAPWPAGGILGPNGEGFFQPFGLAGAVRVEVKTGASYRAWWQDLDSGSWLLPPCNWARVSVHVAEAAAPASPPLVWSFQVSLAPVVSSPPLSSMLYTIVGRQPVGGAAPDTANVLPPQYARYFMLDYELPVNVTGSEFWVADVTHATGPMQKRILNAAFVPSQNAQAASPMWAPVRKDLSQVVVQIGTDSGLFPATDAAVSIAFELEP